MPCILVQDFQISFGFFPVTAVKAVFSHPRRGVVAHPQSAGERRSHMRPVEEELMEGAIQDGMFEDRRSLDGVIVE
ncbi:MAG: hypothetical protein ACE5JD_16705 [Candidatus Methylomirabilia bacterium]